MRKREDAPRFGPGRWVTMRDTGEHVKIEAWSVIASAYRVRSRKNGLQIVTDGELIEMSIHPNAAIGKHWSRCQAPGCGAPLTPGLPECPRCHAPMCTCGRCQCLRAPKTAAAKSPRKKAAAKDK